jgi:hypothetical protein
MEFLGPEDVLKRVPLLTRIAEDLEAQFELRRSKQERLEELVVISRKFSSSELQETISNLRNQVAESKRALEGLEREVRLLGGTVKDARRGIVYFNSTKDDRPILLVWDPAQPAAISWHEVDESFSDRVPIQFEDQESRGASSSTS